MAAASSSSSSLPDQLLAALDDEIALYDIDESAEGGKRQSTSAGSHHGAARTSDESYDAAVLSPPPPPRWRRLVLWNQVMEEDLLRPSPLRISEGEDETLRRASYRLASELVEVLRRRFLLLVGAVNVGAVGDDGDGDGDGDGEASRQHDSSPRGAEASTTPTDEESMEAEAERIVAAMEMMMMMITTTTTTTTTADNSGGSDAREGRDEEVAVLLRSGKNWLRYLLVHHSHGPPAIGGSAAAGAPTSMGDDATECRDCRHHFQSLPMLKLYLLLMDWFCADLQWYGSNDNPEGGGACARDQSRSAESLRCLSLLLFYATFDHGNVTSSSPLPSRGSSALSPIQRSVMALIQERRVFERLLTYLLCVESSALAVTLTRNVHHFLIAHAARPGTAEGDAWEGTRVRLRRRRRRRRRRGLGDETSTPARASAAPTSDDDAGRRSVPLLSWRAPWAEAVAAEWGPAEAPANDNDEAECDGDVVEFTYEAVLVEIVLWSLPDEDRRSSTSNVEIDDRRTELVLEILRIFYVVRLGQNLHEDSASHSTRRLNRGVTMVLRLLELSQNESESPSASPSWQECQDAAIALLMDAQPGFASTVFEAPRAFDSLLSALERHVSRTVVATRVDHAGAAALTPVLAVLLKFCQANTDCRRATKSYVFPNPLPASSATAQSDSKVGDPSRAKNMKPHDAPAGTLLAAMIRLLTWPQSHIKRFAGELLWVLCDQNAAEFVRRVGMGNAMVLLGSKDIVDLPTQLFE